jgi:hypothetical protein
MGQVQPQPRSWFPAPFPATQRCEFRHSKYLPQVPAVFNPSPRCHSFPSTGVTSTALAPTRNPTSTRHNARSMESATTICARKSECQRMSSSIICTRRDGPFGASTERPRGYNACPRNSTAVYLSRRCRTTSRARATNPWIKILRLGGWFTSSTGQTTPRLGCCWLLG